MKYAILTLIAILTMFFSYNVEAVMNTIATATWEAPTTNVDGTPLKDLAGYKVYWGKESRNYTKSENVSEPTTTLDITLTDVRDGEIYYFAVTALDTSGNESEYSDEATLVIPEIDPSKPGNFTITIKITIDVAQ